MLSKSLSKPKTQPKGGTTLKQHRLTQKTRKSTISTKSTSPHPATQSLTATLTTTPLHTSTQSISTSQLELNTTTPQSRNVNLIKTRKSYTTASQSSVQTSTRHFHSTPTTLLESTSTTKAIHPQLLTKEGTPLQRSRTNIVEIINGRSKRWLFDPKAVNRKLHPQWMWNADEDTFNTMLESGRGRLQSTYHDVINTTRSFGYSVLLPAGYPDSVHSCYSAFSTWQFVETSFNQFIHVLCSQAMLSCIGLPTDTASAAGGAVAIKWIAKDGIAHFSKLFFTKRYAYQLDFRPKTWGLVSELLFICGSAFELSTALLAKFGSPDFFLPLAALGASLQSVAHLAWEATHATFNKYLSLRNNLADVTAKADSQMVMSELLGMSFGLFYINYLNEPWHLWAAFLCAIPLHIGSTIGRLHAIKFGKLSSSRLLQHYNSYVQHRLGPTKLQPDISPQDFLGTTAEELAPEIFSNKTKRIDWAKQKMAKNALLVAEFEAQTANSSITPPTSTMSSTPTLKSFQSQQHPKKDAAIQEIQAIQQIMSFASPEQFHHTDIKLGEWFDTKAWVEVYGYPEIKMCATIDEAFETEDELFGAVSLFKDKHYLVNYRPRTNKIYLTFEEECEHDDLMQSLLVATRLAYDIRKHGPPSYNPNTAIPPPQLVDGADDASHDLAKLWTPYNMIRDSLQWSLRYEDQITALLAESWDVDELTWPDTGARVYWEILEQPAPTTPTKI